MKLIARLTASLVLAFGAASAHADEYTLSVEPNYPPEQASQIYQPLLDYLRTATGHTFTLQVPRNYHALWRDMRAGRGADFVFEEAHFADFRATRHGYVPFARVAEPTAYVVPVMPGSASTLRELIGEPLVDQYVVEMPYRIAARHQGCGVMRRPGGMVLSEIGGECLFAPGAARG